MLAGGKRRNDIVCKAAENSIQTDSESFCQLERLIHGTRAACESWQKKLLHLSSADHGYLWPAYVSLNFSSASSRKEKVLRMQGRPKPKIGMPLSIYTEVAYRRDVTAVPLRPCTSTSSGWNGCSLIHLYASHYIHFEAHTNGSSSRHWSFCCAVQTSRYRWGL